MPASPPLAAGHGPARPAAMAILAAWLALAPARADDAGPATTAKPFTGYLKIRQKDGTLGYEVHVARGKVVAGRESHEGRDEATADVVGGWYDRERLVLLVQARDPDVGKPWAAHAHQFRRTEDGFALEHTLYGFGKTIESGEVYRPHVVDRIVEVD